MIEDMSTVQEKVRTGETNNARTLIEEMKLLGQFKSQSGARKVINSELWHACAGPLVSLPQPGSLVYYFPQGHIEQVTASTRRTTNCHVPNYPSLPSQMMCQVHSVTLHADKDTDEIYAQMTLQPVNSENDVFPIPDFGLTKSKQPSEFFCKTLTASDTSTHGGFSVPRRAAEKLFPQLDFSMQPPNQELTVRDLHDNSWTFRHIYRGQPKRHLLTSGWSVFVGAKRLKAGDSVLFIRDEKSQLLLGIRRASRQHTVLPSVLSADSMHLGVLAAAAHAAANHSSFTVYYNPRACPSEFVIPFPKYHKAAYGTQVSIGTRFGMMFETEDSGKRRYMGTVVGVGDYDPLRWPNSKWRNLQVEWDEHSCVERPARVNIWEIETPESMFPFPAFASNLKRHLSSGIVVENGQEAMMKRHTLQSSENVNLSFTHPINPNLQSEIDPLTKAQCLSSDIQVECSRSLYANILQNLKSHELLLSSATSVSCEMRSQMQHDEADEVGVWQNHQFPFVQQLMVPLQGKTGQKHILPPTTEQDPEQQQQQQLANMVLSSSRFITQISQAHVMEKQTSNKPLHELEHLDQDENSKHNDDSIVPEDEDSAPWPKARQKTRTKSRMVVDHLSTESHAVLSPAVSTELLELSGNHFEGNLTDSQCHNDTLTQVSIDKATIQGLAKDLQLIEQHQIISSICQANLDAISSIGVSNVESSHLSSQCLENGWLSSNGPCHQSSNICLSSTEPGAYPIMQMSHMLCPDNITTCSADISNVLDPEVCLSAEGGNFSMISETNDAGVLQSFSHEFLTANQSTQENIALLNNVSSSYGLKDFSDQNGSYCNFDMGNGSMLIDPLSNSCIEGFGTARFSGSLQPPQVHTKCNSCQDVQSQVTSASFVDCRTISFQEFPDCSGNTSSSNVDIGDSCHLNKGWKNVSPPLRTYTKVQKSGSVGRSIDVTRFRNYDELKSAIACMFGLEGQLEDPRGSAWKLVYVDYENDVLLVGDDPWEEFTTCVKCIRILSPSEVQQMSMEGLQHVDAAIVDHADGMSSQETGQP